MRRWLTLVLLFVLPLQFAWAAAATYCGHEAVPAKAHVGHHAHEHAAEPAEAGADKQHAKAGKLTADNDCGYCQLSFAKPMLPLALQFDTDAHTCIDIAPQLAFESRGPDHHDRPKWQLA